VSKIQEISKAERPIMGEAIPLIVFRAFRHFSSDYVEEIMGRGVNVVFQNGGRELGKEVGANLYQSDINDYLGGVIQWVADAKIGVLKPAELSESRLVVQLDECITCAGMDPIGKRICHFEVGLVAGVVEAYLKRKVPAEETQCNANGESTCEVTVRLK
jgi:predicted hydrocarbon binding protein